MHCNALHFFFFSKCDCQGSVLFFIFFILFISIYFYCCATLGWPFHFRLLQDILAKTLIEVKNFYFIRKFCRIKITFDNKKNEVSLICSDPGNFVELFHIRQKHITNVAQYVIIKPKCCPTLKSFQKWPMFWGKFYCKMFMIVSYGDIL